MNHIPSPSDDRFGSANSAADLIRQKLQQIYQDEPNAREELAEAQSTTHRSAHGQFMYDLSTSGKSLAEIQTAWHNYYIGLPDTEKHRVWQEFYAQHSKIQTAATMVPVQASPKSATPHKRPADTRTVKDIKHQLLARVKGSPKIKKGGHFKSLMFGLSSGLIVVVILLLGFFNERFLIPFISPSRSVSATPIIVDPSNNSAGPESKIIIPKINVEIPVIYDEPSIQEEAVQNALERGVVHYATTVNPGELGNGTIFGHSSNNILNKGKYKFAFVLLKRLENGDTFILQKDGKQYVYRVFAKKVVRPEDVSVLADTGGKPATFSLITCDPPGTTLNRLVVTGEQISPSPEANIAPATKPTSDQPATLPGNPVSLWQRLKNFLTN